MNEQISQAVDNFINSPVGSIVAGVLGLILIFLVIFSKTSLGKKLFNKTQTDIKAIHEIARLSNESVNNVKLLATEKINALTSDYERKSAIIVSYYNELELGVFEILEKIPNVKVQKELKAFQVKFEEKKLEIASQLPTYEDFVKLTEKARDVEIQVEEKVKKIESAYNQTLAQLQEMYDKKFKELEDKLNEREEEIDTNAEV